MSIQSTIDAHVSESGFFNKEILIKDQKGSVVIPDGAHIRFFDCDIEEMTSENEKNVVYVKGGKIDSLKVTSGEFHIYNTQEVGSIDISNCHVYIDGDATKVKNKFRTKNARLELQNVSFEDFTSTPLFDCVGSIINLYDCSTTCGDGGIVSGGSVHLENFEFTSNGPGIHFMDGCEGEIYHGNYTASQEWALKVDNTRLFITQETELSGKDYDLLLVNNGYINISNNVSFGAGEQAHSIHASDSFIRITNLNEVPSMYLDNSTMFCHKINTINILETKSSDTTFYDVLNFDSIEIEDGDLAIRNADGVNSINLKNGNLSLVDVKNVEDGITLEDASCSIVNCTSCIKGSADAINVTNSTLTLVDIAKIQSGTVGVNATNSKVSANNVTEVLAGTNGFVGTSSEMSLVDVKNMTVGTYIASVTDGRLSVVGGDSWTGSIYSSNSNFYCDGMGELTGNMIITASEKKFVLRDMTKCSGNITCTGVIGEVSGCQDIQGNVSFTDTMISFKGNDITGNYTSSNSKNTHSDTNITGNFGFSGGMEDVSNCTISGNISGTSTLKINNSSASNVSAVSVEAWNVTASTWSVSVGSFRGCSGTANISGAAESIGGTLIIAGYAAPAMRYTYGSIIDLATQNIERHADNRIQDYADQIHHDSGGI